MEGPSAQPVRSNRQGDGRCHSPDRPTDLTGIDATLRHLAETQHGLITVRQALGVGLTRRQVQCRVESGQWIPRASGVYAVAGTPPTHHHLLAVATLAADPGAVVSHRAAAALWNVDLGSPPPREITVTRPQRPRIADVVVHQSRDLTPAQVEERDGLLLTSPTRTLVDLGQVVRWWVVERTLESMVSKRLVTIQQVHASLELHSRRGRVGCGALRHVLERRGLGGADSDSVLEAAFANLCRQAGLPTPDYQHEVQLAGRSHHVDFAYPEHRLAVEVDGFEHHSGRGSFEEDRRRDAELLVLGWRVLRFTWMQVIHRDAWVASVVREALAATDPTGRR